ncbi:hypothetical protein DI005_11665 [Prauserella sp. PE36]|uniref:Uncharacterized protein n=1 Tax=Prauserella endophytica TaxID=1592324 RepID=A0ABY2S8L3_9PSEU|nr:MULTISPECIES: hypothetical protein [Prauserella]RBM20999.1 hypothetical protein DI005_11665 [Prauserella sp. PE36]TKG72223.1 hypothetical protein FCN18_08165 [Prauserella endophytica]
MTEQDDRIAEALTGALRRHAEGAPSSDGLAERVLARTSTRRTRRGFGAVAAVVLAVVVLSLGAVLLAQDRGGDPVAEPVLPQGWRWESYRGVAIGVPTSWGYGVPGPSWCSRTPEAERPPLRSGAVGRPAGMRAVGCPSQYPPLAEREQWLTFEDSGEVGIREFDGGWVEETRELDGVFVTLFSANDALRAQVLGTLRPTSEELALGCGPMHPAAEGRGYRPEPGGPLAPGEVRSVSVCRYARSDAVPSGPPLLAARVVSGDEALRLASAVLTAPEGAGPDDPESCAPEYDYGPELILLHLRADDRSQEVLVRYAGCEGNGTDDGTTRRALTGDLMWALDAPPTSPGQFQVVVAQLMR